MISVTLSPLCPNGSFLGAYFLCCFLIANIFLIVVINSTERQMKIPLTSCGSDDTCGTTYVTTLHEPKLECSITPGVRLLLESNSDTSFLRKNHLHFRFLV